MELMVRVVVFGELMNGGKDGFWDTGMDVNVGGFGFSHVIRSGRRT